MGTLKYLENIKHIFLQLVTISSISALLIVFFLNAQYTSFTYSSWYPLIFENSWVSSFLKIILMSIGFYGLYLIVRKLNFKVSITLIILINAFTLGVKMWLVYAVGSYPVADSYLVLESANAIVTNSQYIPSFLSAYLSHIPRQLGLVSLLIPLVKWAQFDYFKILYLQAFIIQASLVFLSIGVYRYKGIKAAVVVSVLLNLFLPNSYLVLWLYGEPYALFFTSIAFAFLPTQKRSFLYLVIFIGSIILAYLARVTSNLWILALVISFILVKPSRLGLAVVLISVLGLTYPIVQTYYQDMIPIHAYPNNTWLRIGTGYSGFDLKTPGFYNDQIEEDFIMLNEDTQAMADYNNSQIMRNLASLVETKTLGTFLYQKMIVTWTDPDFEMMSRIYPFYGSLIENPMEQSKSVLYGSAAMDFNPQSSSAKTLQNLHSLSLKFESTFYLVLLLLVLSQFIFHRKDNGYHVFIRLLFLAYVAFYLGVEVKGRYPFLMLEALIVYASLEYMDFFLWIQSKLSTLLKRG